MGLIYTFCIAFLRTITKIFFKQIHIVGLEQVPKDCPLIICGNHANQFIDPLIITSYTNREIGFLIAAKSMAKPIIGHIARLLKGIPVVRSQDLAKSGAGIIKSFNKESKLLIGEGTKFQDQVKEGDVIKLQVLKQEFFVEEIKNNETLLVKQLEKDLKNSEINVAYKVIPKIDQGEMYTAVWDVLRANGCVGIFPEGGSHDRTELLPLKAGVCIMALGAMAKYNAPVKIVTVGLNYFRGYRFRSKVVLQYNQPYEIPKELAQLYQTNKKEAIAKLLIEIEKRLRDVTLTAPDYKTLTSIFLARKLYTPENRKLAPHEELSLNRRLSEGYQKLKDKPEVKQLFESICLYGSFLKQLGLRDYELKNHGGSNFKELGKIAYSFVVALIYLLFSLPGLILTVPLGLLIRYLGEKERKRALATSDVKILGKDVVASHKVVCAMIIFPIAFCIFFVLHHFLMIYLLDDVNEVYAKYYDVLFVIWWPFYLYTMIIAGDELVLHLRTIKSKLIILFVVGKLSELKGLRQNLKDKIIEFVDKYGEEYVDNFASNRVISKEELYGKNDFEIDHAFSTLKEVEYGDY